MVSIGLKMKLKNIHIYGEITIMVEHPVDIFLSHKPIRLIIFKINIIN